MSQASPAGELSVTVGWDGARVLETAVVLERPRASALLPGHTAAEALALVPCLFAICAGAQAAATRASLAAAGAGVPPSSGDEGIVLREAAQEHLWRLLRDWPRALGVAPRDDVFAAWYRRLAAAPRAGAAAVARDLAGFVDAEVLGPGWSAVRGRADLEAWAAAATSHAAALVRALLPGAPAAPVQAGWLRPAAPLVALGGGRWGPERETRPTAAGGPAETGALARFGEAPPVADVLAREGRSLLARLVARLCDLADVARRLAGEAPAASIAAASPEPQVGVARVETARGALLHRVRVSAGRIAEYAVVAPTAWNFHPRGAFAEACAGVRADSEAALRAEVARWVLAFDPCVPWRLRIQRSA